MITAVDTSVLIAIAKGEKDADTWVELLAAESARGDLVICEMVAAELFALLGSGEKFKDFVQRVGIQFRTASKLPKWLDVFFGATGKMAARVNT